MYIILSMHCCVILWALWLLFLNVCWLFPSILLPAWRSKCGICYRNVAGWLGVCLSHAGIVSKWLNLSFSTFCSPIILVSSDPCADTQFQGEPLQRGPYIHGGWEKLAIFDGNCRLSRKWCEICRWLLWNVNSKSWVPDRLVSFLMTLSDP